MRCVGCASGAGPIREVPGAFDELDGTDRVAYELLPDDLEAAARVYEAAFEPMARRITDGDDDAVVAAFESMLSASDMALLEDPLIRADAVANARESFLNVVWGDFRLFRLCAGLTAAIAAVVAARQIRDTLAAPAQATAAATAGEAIRAPCRFGIRVNW